VPGEARRDEIDAFVPGDGGVLRSMGIEGCVRLPLDLDLARLAAEIDALRPDDWLAPDGAGRDPVVQASVESFFAVGHPRGRRPLPPEDRPVLARLPALRALVREVVPASPTRTIVARLRPDSLLPVHTDTPRFFRGTLRLSVTVSVDGAQRLFCGGRWYDMRPGELWAIDNLRPHGLINRGTSPRINVIADFVPSAALRALVASGERGLGVRDDAAQADLERRTRTHYRRTRLRALRYELYKLLWRRG
jgi:Aspartyl/Asparaginyl beta-hydroxylase